MNLTIGRKFPRFGRSIQWQHASFASGLVLGVAAAVGMGALDREGAPATTPAQVQDQARPVTSGSADLQAGAILNRPGAAPSDAPRRPLVLVVASLEEASHLRDGMAGDGMAAAMEGRWVPPRKTSFLVVDSAAQEQVYATMVEEQMLVQDQMLEGQPGFEIVDLRW